jgi:hypothetical protein
MSEIKFACPYCSQHVVCDEAFCGEKIDCPGCGRELFVPPRAAFIPLQSGDLTLALPVASKEPRHIPVPDAALANQNGAAGPAFESRGEKFPLLLPFWVLLFLPFVLALVFVRRRGGLVLIEYLFVLFAIAAGFYLAVVQKKSELGVVLRGILYTIAMLFVFAIVAVGLLFVGCLIILSNSH